MRERGGNPGQRLLIRVSRWIVRLYPRDLRRRFGGDIASALDASVAAGVPAQRILVDAVSTLSRSWADRLGRARKGRGRSSVADVGGDLRHALRSAARDPLYSGMVVVTLAVAIGANAAVFDVAWSVLIRSLPYADPERVVSVVPSPVRFTATGYGVSTTLTDVPQIESAAAYTPGGRASLGAEGGAAEVSVTQATGNFFEVLGVSTQWGAGLAAATEGEHGAVLSHGLWRSAFGGDPGVVGTTILLSGNPVLVTGIAPPEVAVPAGTDIWLTYPLVGGFFGAASSAEVIARVSSAGLIEEARAAHLARVTAQWTSNGDELPEWYRDMAFTPLRSALVGSVREALVALFAAASLVLLLGCINLAGVTVARRSARAGELAVRRALGAGRARLVRMMMAESLVLALLAGLPALAFVVWGRSVLSRMLPGGLPGLADVGPGVRSLGFIAAAAVAAGLAVGALPAFYGLSEASRMGVAGRVREQRRRLHPGLVMSQIALAVLLVIGAGLLGRSLVVLRSVPLGYDIEHVLTFEVQLPDVAYAGADAWRGYAGTIAERLAAVPGVEAVGLASRLPLGEGLGSAFRLWPAGVEESDPTASASVVWATSPFFDAFGIPLLAGGTFESGNRHSIVISRALALSLFGRADVVGEQVRMRASMRVDPELMTIAGVADDTRLSGYETAVSEVLYLPFGERPQPWMAFAMRATGDPATLAGSVRHVVAAVDANVAPFRMMTTGEAARNAVATREALTLAALLFGAAALLLSVLGTYGLLAQSVARRRRELGIRMAIGARGTDVMRMVLGEAGRLSVAGALLGIVAALALTRLLRGLLWSVEATDPLTFAVVPILVLFAALVAAAVPARRATRVDPAESLRGD
jgi:predicted permease